MEFKGSVAIVTGGGTGIGRSVCESLARAGAAAIAVNYSQSKTEAEATVEELRQLGCKAEAIRADISDETQARAMIDEFTERHGRLDILVNNAGITRRIAFTDLDAVTQEIWDQLLAVNLLGPFYCSRAAGPALKKARGAIVNVSSISAMRAAGSSLPYGVSKAALLQLTRGMALALAPEVRVNAVAPGAVATRWHVRLVGEERFNEMAKSEEAKSPLGQMSTPDHVAQAVMGLLQSDMVTGETVIVDGGEHLLY
ncbi:MAG TPA: SDR family oxidoreductase [Candidatus Dormibacteraeota bacterium]|nr:SDR family oxidoreductase [Candidatus Dormibacteraeota bacterium]